MPQDFYANVKDQFVYGGVKYANSKEREVTDILTDDYGLNGLLWCINKYVYRYKNLKRPKDLLKIGTYMYILWLKFGFHISELGTVAENYTTVDTKAKHFDEFVNIVKQYDVPMFTDRDRIFQEMTDELKSLRLRANMTKYRLFNVFRYAEGLFGIDGWTMAETLDTDTWNEGKKA